MVACHGAVIVASSHDAQGLLGPGTHVEGAVAPAVAGDPDWHAAALNKATADPKRHYSASLMASHHGSHKKSKDIGRGGRVIDDALVVRGHADAPLNHHTLDDASLKAHANRITNDTWIMQVASELVDRTTESDIPECRITESDIWTALEPC